MNLVGKRKLNNAVTRALCGFGISKARLSDKYSYIFEDESITYKITENDVEDKMFIDFIRERFDFEVTNPFMMSVLHEVGHHKANEEIYDAIYDFCISEKERISREMQSANAVRTRELEYQYFNLPDEIMATQWAVNYAKKYPTRVQRMWEDIQNALTEFYKANITE